MIVPSAVTILNIGSVTDPVDIISVVARILISVFSETIVLASVLGVDPESVVPVSILETGLVITPESVAQSQSNQLGQ